MISLYLGIRCDFTSFRVFFDGCNGTRNRSDWLMIVLFGFVFFLVTYTTLSPFCLLVASAEFPSLWEVVENGALSEVCPWVLYMVFIVFCVFDLVN